ncbi:CitMHS family transporter [Metabacillus bambusae]|uniref:Citrate transporter n=1 Tax=Metabacillus bambusae TaxID=2795218 RepID=A0ABS3N9D4_9BACI|nr:citrate:proton symporter [Metabacillus bambusae]MBO1514907.1 citrate transporter [Metabacillus bambusae]
MLTFLGFAMISVFMYLIMSKRFSALNSLIAIPVIFALIGGFTDLGPMIMSGLESIAPTAIMVVFAILYFGILIDSGFFDPLVSKILKLVKGDPLKISLGTAALAMVVALDGDGTITYLIVVTAMLPLYDRLGMNRLILACLPALAMGIMNLLPWGGPTARVMTIFDMDAMGAIGPIIPSMIAGGIWVFAVAYFMGLKERKRLGVNNDINETFIQEIAATVAEQKDVTLKRPKLFWFNLVLTLLLLVTLVMGLLPLPGLFMLAFVIVISVNYPSLTDQKERLEGHAGNILTVVSMIFGAGIFTGILEGTKMDTAMADSLVAIIPESFGALLPVIVAVTSLPFTFVLANDPYYFGIVPIIAETASGFGINPNEIGHASLLGQPLHLLSPLQGSIYVLIGLLGIGLNDHIRFTAKYAIGTGLVMTIVAVLFGTLSI